MVRLMYCNEMLVAVILQLLYRAVDPWHIKGVGGAIRLSIIYEFQKFGPIETQSSFMPASPGSSYREIQPST